jgi:uncharacterized protein YprB with RNaseH-like and TPR domain
MDNLRERLRRMGVVKGARELKAAPPSPPAAPAEGRQRDVWERLMPGSRVVENEFGRFLLTESVWPLHHPHGCACPADLLPHSAAPLRPLFGHPLAEQFSHYLFLDTETTGLGGTGAVAFMVGLAWLEPTALVVQQLFLRDLDEEPAMLHHLNSLAPRFQSLATFNGRSFDLPLLETRGVLNRQPCALSALPHLDLLWPARRIWRRRLGSVALGALEPALLQIGRTGNDVPGWLIPQLYHNWLRAGEAEPLAGVFYHNRVDLISMVTLLVRLMQVVTEPENETESADLLSLALWQQSARLPQAEQTLRLALEKSADHLPAWHAALLALAHWLKQHDRRAEAVPLWLQLAHTTTDDPRAHIELAKYYEWHAADSATALLWTERALALVARRDAVLSAELHHRRNRLLRKQEAVGR